MNTTNRTEHEQLFFDEGYLLGKKAINEIANEEAFLPCVGSMYSAIDGLIDSLLAMAKKQEVTVDCQKGCAWCCHQAVFANSYEIHLLGNFIKKNTSTAFQKEIRERAAMKNATTSKMDEAAVLSYKSPCPLLIDGACSVYQARPMACRIYLSTKVSSCFEFFQNPDNPDNFPALLDFPLMAGRMMNEGFMSALEEGGVQIAEFRLEDGIQTILATGSNFKNILKTGK